MTYQHDDHFDYFNDPGLFYVPAQTHRRRNPRMQCEIRPSGRRECKINIFWLDDEIKKFGRRNHFYRTNFGQYNQVLFQLNNVDTGTGMVDITVFPERGNPIVMSVHADDMVGIQYVGSQFPEQRRRPPEWYCAVNPYDERCW
ncbi:hypothetical protein [Brevibacillus sp. DP1.3A]|uniref:hypothetical protein n=1 Tax=Brevibacillus sp. DP1.3A TaxID=2738867 RepID=UPI00156BAA37|nr:hypothetical protein [Brevibacillus sp. DP1.3A]MED1914726.1 hypothetical protein [Bacillus thuringiensis]UED74796.1 hypothetical protein HP399_029620 [Brevibacillus sp. DP1.3A]